MPFVIILLSMLSHRIVLQHPNSHAVAFYKAFVLYGEVVGGQFGMKRVNEIASKTAEDCGIE